MTYRYIKKILRSVSHTLLHPQWFVYKNNHNHHSEIGEKATGKVLDIGCADQFIKKYLSSDTYYIGLDYYSTAIEWYGTTPVVFADAQQLPFSDGIIDTVLLLDVLEHIPKFDLCLSEIYRVLKTKGTLILQVPFLYPIHDAPLDFHRWTIFGLLQCAGNNGFVVKGKTFMGKPIETAGLMFNVALCKLLVNWFRSKSPVLILGVVFIPTVFVVNMLCWLLALVSPPDDFMPLGYRLVLEKTRETNNNNNNILS